MSFRKKLYCAAGNTTTFMGPGRKEFDPKNLRPFEEYLTETADGTCRLVKNIDFDEGVIGSFMPGRFLDQANIPGFLPFMVPNLYGKPCLGVEGACGTGGRAVASGAKSILSDLSDAVFVSAFEMQNRVKSVYGADILAGAAYYQKERKNGQAYFFPGIFGERAGVYYDRYGYEKTREAMAKWHEQSILNARKNPKAQEYHNDAENLFERGMTPPNPDRFLPHLNLYDCSKITDGAASIVLLSEDGLKKCGVDKSDCAEIVAIGEAEGDITKKPKDFTVFSTTKIAVDRALKQANISLDDIGILELHDCFTITAIIALETIGFAKAAKGPEFILSGKTAPEGEIPTNLSGGLGGFGHPTGASGVRQLVDLWMQFTSCAPYQAKIKKPYGMMISMGGNDKTVTCIIVKAAT